MTWEIVTLLSVLALCGSAVFCIKEFLMHKYAHKEDTSLDEVKIRLEKYDNLFDRQSAEIESVHKLSEETKKMLSNANLAVGLRGR